MWGNATYNEENIIVRDNCHVTGKYRGSAHSPCNRSFRLTKIIPVVFHNLRGYDSHLIMQEMRGGAHRYSKANNKYMSDYKPDEASKYIIYLDANNLYGWAVIQDLPTGGLIQVVENKWRDRLGEVCGKQEKWTYTGSRLGIPRETT
jgi:hypothetical protein